MRLPSGDQADALSLPGLRLPDAQAPRPPAGTRVLTGLRPRRVSTGAIPHRSPGSPAYQTPVARAVPGLSPYVQSYSIWADILRMSKILTARFRSRSALGPPLEFHLGSPLLLPTAAAIANTSKVFTVRLLSKSAG